MQTGGQGQERKRSRASRIRSGTLHAFCFGLLGREDVLDATGRVPRPLLAIEERFLLEDLNDAEFGNLHDRRRRLQAFNAAWARLQSETPGWPADPIDQAFQRELSKWLRFHEAMLIGKLVPESLRYLRENPASQHRDVFWKALESVPGLSAVDAEWRMRCGAEYASVKSFLRPNGRRASSHPCTVRPGCGCAHEVVVHGQDDIVAVCRCGRGCMTYPLKASDIALCTPASPAFAPSPPHPPSASVPAPPRPSPP